MHALIIEAEALVALMIEDGLRDLGYTSFAFATTAQEAIAAAGDRSPDLITADVQLSIGCGIEAVRIICSDRPIPVVFVADALGEVSVRAPNAVTLRKPFPVGALEQAVARARLQQV